MSPFVGYLIMSQDVNGTFCPVDRRKEFPIGTDIKTICIESGLVSSGREYKELIGSIKMNGLSIKERFDDEKFLYEILHEDDYKDRGIATEKSKFYLTIGKKYTNARLITIVDRF